jgi:hypothetical protein
LKAAILGHLKDNTLSIIEAFSQAGIKPGLALNKAISGFGFDSKSVGDLAEVSHGGKRPPPPKHNTQYTKNNING